MLNDEHLSLVRRGTGYWNDWYQRHRDTVPDLHGADLSAMDLSGIDLSRANLVGANLAEVNLSNGHLHGADLAGANLVRANLRFSDLSGATFEGANLRDADLRRAVLENANLGMANLTGTDLSSTKLGMAVLHAALSSNTIWVNAQLGACLGLDKLYHFGPSFIDINTAMKFELPSSFLRGCGLPDTIIDQIASLRDAQKVRHSCFILFASTDEEFAAKLHDDLQHIGVRCWLAARDLPWGAKNWESMDEELMVRDRLIVVLSKASIGSKWLSREMERARAAERIREEVVILPLRIDDVPMPVSTSGTFDRCDGRIVIDFRKWNNKAEYLDNFNQILSHLQIAPSILHTK